MAPLIEYIEEWLNKVLIETTKPENQETVREIIPPQLEHIPITEPTASKWRTWYFSITVIRT